MKLPSLREPIRDAALATICWVRVAALVVMGVLAANADQGAWLQEDSSTLDGDSCGHLDLTTTLELASELDPQDSAFTTEGTAGRFGQILAGGDSCEPCDRLWLISTRHLSSCASGTNLDEPDLAVYQLREGSPPCRVSIDDYLQAVGGRRSAVIYVHGNRIPSDDAVQRGRLIYQTVKHCRDGNPIDWVIWSWPSDKQGILTHDARIKAARTDGQGLYLAWLLRKHAQFDVDNTLIGYSFGARIITGALHAMAGGTLGGKMLPGEPQLGRRIEAGLVAPAIDSGWMSNQGYHRLATQNLDRLVLLYNRRDAVLKRYWLIDRVRGRMALGYSGPSSFADRFDGSDLPVFSRDCSPSVGLQHDELDYYRKSCRAGLEMARLIDDVDARQ
jgi:hypothetical protein